MRDFSKVSPALHNSDRFRALGDDHAAVRVYFYLITCPHGNSTGCFALKDGYACDDLFMDLETYQRAMQRLCEVSLIAYDRASKVVLIEKWVDHNHPTNPKHALGILNILSKMGKSDLAARRYAEFAQVLRAKSMTRDASVRSAMEDLSETYAKGIATLVDQTETRLDQTLVDQTERREKPRTAARVPATLTGGTRSPLDDPQALYEQLLAEQQQQASTLKHANVTKLLNTALMKRATA